MASHENEVVKRRYFRWLKGAKGYAEQTVVAVERAIHLFEESTNYKDFKTFNERQALAFKSWLDDRKTRGRKLESTTKYHHLRHLSAFFSWLASQSGFKTRISLDAVSYLSLDKKTVREALTPRAKKFPSLKEVVALVESIPAESDIDRRDRALIAFLLLSGMRYTAICSLSLGCFDIDSLTVNQDPRLGVDTKGGKAILTKLFTFDDGLIRCVTDWVRHLESELSFGPTDPLFPKTRMRQAEDSLSFEVDGVEPVFWSGGNSIRDILKRRSQGAGVRYYNPHSFRHAAVHLAAQYCTTPEQFKAVSQNLGHEHVATTLKTYGMLDDSRVMDVVAQIDFSRKPGQKSGAGIPKEALESFLKQYEN